MFRVVTDTLGYCKLSVWWVPKILGIAKENRDWQRADGAFLYHFLRDGNDFFPISHWWQNMNFIHQCQIRKTTLEIKFVQLLDMNIMKILGIRIVTVTINCTLYKKITSLQKEMLLLITGLHIISQNFRP